MTDKPIRRGLPRPGEVAPTPLAPSVVESVESSPRVESAAAQSPPPSTGADRGLPRPGRLPNTLPAPAPTAAPGAAATPPPRPRPTSTCRVPAKSHPTRQRLWELGILGLFGGFAGLILATSAVIGVRVLLQLDVMQDFMTTYPGEYESPIAPEHGFPTWVQWQHFVTTVLIVLIIRSGWQECTQRRPSSFWTPRWSKDGDGKISLNLWFHLSLNILWVTNGIVFIVMLFVTGHWVRIVPTSWEVIPNAISSALQYVSLDWPAHNGWMNYNSLQQIMYFITVFIAAPLAMMTGVRMSSVWPKNARISRLYPVQLARAVHFPVMLYFVAFTIVHVALVLATGALRNLNHIYGGTDVVSWVGFALFAGSMMLIITACLLARPIILAPLANLTGRVSSR